jgi:hypothetical protein
MKAKFEENITKRVVKVIGTLEGAEFGNLKEIINIP